MSPEEVRRARREFVRRHHPDAGGDPRLFVAGLTAYDVALRRALARDTPAAPLPAPAAAVKRLATRWLRDWQALPRDVGDAYRAGRDTDDPI